MLLCLSVFSFLLFVFFASCSNFNPHSLIILLLALFLLVVLFSYSFTLNMDSLFFNYLGIAHFSLFTLFNYMFSFIVLLVCVVLLWFILTYFKWFYFILWFILVFFTFFLSICSYVISFNFILMFLFWELMGVCWFFLISSFFYRTKTRFASFIAFFWNLSGDFALLLYILISLIIFSTLTLSYNYYFIISCFLLLIAIFAKSAVYPFQTWLYYAMEGPTPVSAFLHAAWMITAGVYLFFIFPIFLDTFYLLFCLFWILYFSFNAIFYFDLKKIIASSTGSQMGYIFLFFWFKFVLNGLLLFSYHAVFKSYFFFLAGFIISNLFDYQDFRLQLSFSFWFFFLLFCSLSLVGCFFFWTGIIKEIFVFSYLFSIMIKFSFFFIFIFWFIYSFKLFIMRFHSIIISQEIFSLLIWMFLILLFNISYCYLNWNVNYPLYFFSLFYVFYFSFITLLFFLFIFNFYVKLIDFWFMSVFKYFFWVLLILYKFSYDIYLFYSFFFS